MNDNSNSYQLGSFRDPSGNVFIKNKQIYRKINSTYLPVYQYLKESGLLKNLQQKELLIKHEEIAADKDNFIIQPERIPFVSYPYEWSFSQIKEAALLTLKIQYESLKYNLILKDASAFNVQFIGKKPVFIDTTSFDLYEEGRPWIAYKHFCENFLSPLLLLKYSSEKLLQLWYSNIDGIPIDLLSRLLPFKTHFYSLSLIHVHSHARMLKRNEKKNLNNFVYKITKKELFKLIEHLYEGIGNLKFKKFSHWNNYYISCNYTKNALNEKLNFIKDNLIEEKDGNILDIGCNEGYFAKALRQKENYIIAIDSDSLVINNLYNNLEKETNILPLVIDISNPTPSIGWQNNERMSFIDRIGSDNITLALAIIHHLRIYHNIPLTEIAHFFAKISKQLFLEFVPKEDSQAMRLLNNKRDVYDDYNQQNLEFVFSKYFQILKSKQLSNSKRVMYNLVRK